MREVLPIEAKDMSKQHLYIKHDEEQVPHDNLNTTDDGNVVNLTTNHNVIDVEIPESEKEEWINFYPYFNYYNLVTREEWLEGFWD